MSSGIQLEVRGAWLDAREAEHRIEVAEVAVTQAAENLRVARDRYKAGAGTNTEVLDAQALQEQALNNRDSANFDAALAALRLARASGQL
jgi:outer membrane protein TolC